MVLVESVEVMLAVVGCYSTMILSDMCALAAVFIQKREYTVAEQFYRKMAKEEKSWTDVKLKSSLHARFDKMGRSGLPCSAIASSVEF